VLWRQALDSGQRKLSRRFYRPSLLIEWNGVDQHISDPRLGFRANAVRHISVRRRFRNQSATDEARPVADKTGRNG
jgi:hypothetical protein